ncbi:Avirulence (Avh) protein [Phytophthora megakarya]|uniref:RxLR effector protein n=1 Tax=Phytophthora megakarya TaxID=4795 RepID=A0A225W8Z6_9STRA|nr:Avirulence (Avh) protein [Phytophthora megakarya]
MHLSQVLVVGAASFLFASEAIAVAMDSNHVKTPTVERDDPNQRLLRSYSKPVEDDSDDFDDSDDLDSLDDTE